MGQDGPSREVEWRGRVGKSLIRTGLIRTNSCLALIRMGPGKQASKQASHSGLCATGEKKVVVVPGMEGVLKDTLKPLHDHGGSSVEQGMWDRRIHPSTRYHIQICGVSQVSQCTGE